MTEEQDAIDERDIRWVTYTNSSPTIKMTVIHEPTGVRVSVSGTSRYRCRKEALRKLVETLDAKEA